MDFKPEWETQTGLQNFTCVEDVSDLEELVQRALQIKTDPYAHDKRGRHKTLGLIFMNPSLRTRMSTQKAARNLGMDVLVMNIDRDGWKLEMEDGAVMNGKTVEHIRDAAAVMGQYCDIIGLRCFAGLKDREEDYSEQLLKKFMAHSRVPVISMESATLHPLQSLTDLVTIREHWHVAERPKVVLTWAPHVRPIPQAVANSFASWLGNADVELVVTQPEGFELDEKFSGSAVVTHDQEEALRNADFVYAKNWSAYRDYGKVALDKNDWMLTAEKMKLTNQAKVMHCLPVRRNLELPGALIDHPDSLILEQAANRVFAAQAVLQQILENIPA